MRKVLWTLVLYLFTLGNAQWTTLDDSAASISYNGQGWYGMYGLHFNNDSACSYTFTFTGVGFRILCGSKRDRGYFDVTVDNSFVGQGDAYSLDTVGDTTEIQFQVGNLQFQQHTVTVYNSKVPDSRLYGTTSPYLTLAGLQIDTTPPLPSSSSAALPVAPTSQQPVSSSSLSASSSGNLPQSTSSASISQSSASSSKSSGNSTGPIVGGVAAGAIALATLSIALYCVRRRRHRQQAIITRAAIDEDDGDLPHAPVEPYQPSMQETWISSPSPTVSHFRSSYQTHGSGLSEAHLYVPLAYVSPPTSGRNLYFDIPGRQSTSDWNSNRTSDSFTGGNRSSMQSNSARVDEEDLLFNNAPPTYENCGGFERLPRSYGSPSTHKGILTGSSS